MATPEESYEIAVDESNTDEERARAIGQLRTANECAMLADLATMDSLDGRYRERALEGLGHPQCVATLQRLVEGEGLPGGLRDRAESLLEETPTDSGAGP